MPANIAIVYHSGYGHTEVLANAVKQGAEKAGATVSFIKIGQDGKIEDGQWDDLDAAHAVIFGSPTYMGAASGQFKIFQDDTSRRWAVRKWQNKLAGGFTISHSFSGDKLNTLVQFAILAAQHGMIWVPLGLPGISAEDEKKYHMGAPEAVNRIGSSLGPMAQSENDAPEKTPPSGDVETARIYGEHMVEAVNRWYGKE